MKKKVAAYIRQLGGIPKYSGKTKTMFVCDDFSNAMNPTAQLVEYAVIDKFGFGLPFSIATS